MVVQEFEQLLKSEGVESIKSVGESSTRTVRRWSRSKPMMKAKTIWCAKKCRGYLVDGKC